MWWTVVSVRSLSALSVKFWSFQPFTLRNIVPETKRNGSGHYRQCRTPRDTRQCRTPRDTRQCRTPLWLFTFGNSGGKCQLLGSSPRLIMLWMQSFWNKKERIYLYDESVWQFNCPQWPTVKWSDEWPVSLPIWSSTNKWICFNSVCISV